MGKGVSNLISFVKSVGRTYLASLGIIAATILLLCAPPLFAKGNIAAGKEKSATCVACHGVDGNTEIGQWPKLAGQHQNYLIKQLNAFKQGEKTGRHNDVMYPIVANLSEQDIVDLAAYYASLSPTTGVVEEQKLELGQQLYRGGDLKKGIPACMACHGPRGRGNAQAHFPALAGQNPTYTLSQLQAFKDSKRKNDSNKIMREIAMKMNKEEMEAVASYIAGLH